MNKERKLTEIQKEVLVGILLGDAHLEEPSRLKVEQGDKHRAYIEHLFEVFRDFIKASQVRARPVQIGERLHTNWCFQTIHHSSFHFYLQQFYKEKKKKVPADIYQTEAVLAPWLIGIWTMAL